MMANVEFGTGSASRFGKILRAGGCDGGLFVAHGVWKKGGGFPATAGKKQCRGLRPKLLGSLLGCLCFDLFLAALLVLKNRLKLL
jgi:hypothetical protein